MTEVALKKISLACEIFKYDNNNLSIQLNFPFVMTDTIMANKYKLLQILQLFLHELPLLIYFFLYNTVHCYFLSNIPCTTILPFFKNLNFFIFLNKFH